MPERGLDPLIQSIDEGQTHYYGDGCDPPHVPPDPRVDPLTESCGNCRYSDPRIGDNGDPYLRCRRYPPIITMLDDPDPLSVFSQTDANEWCGEWSAHA